MKTKMLKKLMVSTATMAALGLTGNVFAFTGSIDGTPAEVQVQASVSSVIGITGGGDIIFPSDWNGIDAVDANTNLCVYTNNEDPLLDITFTSTNATGDTFNLKRKGANALSPNALIPYTIAFQDATGQSSTGIKSGITWLNLKASNKLNCDSELSNLKAIISTQATPVAAGDFEDTLTITAQVL